MPRWFPTYSHLNGLNPALTRERTDPAAVLYLMLHAQWTEKLADVILETSADILSRCLVGPTQRTMPAATPHSTLQCHSSVVPLAPPLTLSVPSYSWLDVAKE